MRLILNIGLNVGATQALAAHVVLEIVKAGGFIVHKHAVHQSDTEATVVALVSVDQLTLGPGMVAARLTQIAADLDQDCISVHYPLWRSGLEGSLFGPRAAAWGEFNPDYFLMLNGQRLREPVKAAA